MSSSYSSRNLRDWLGYLTEDEYATLKGLAEDLDSGATVINIGAGIGTSGLLFVETLLDSGYVYTVDIQDESHPLGCLSAERSAFRRADLMHFFNSHWFQIHSDSKIAGKEWDGAAVDLLFIDGLHSYAGCYGDIINWYDHVKVGGIIAIHDYEPTHPMKQQVYAATNDLLLDITEVVTVVDCMIVLRKIDDSGLGVE